MPPPAYVCDKIGIKFTSKEEFITSLQNVNPTELTNNAVYEIYTKVQKKKKAKGHLCVSWQEIKDALGSLYKTDLSQMPYSYIHTSFEHVKIERSRRMAGKNQSALQAYLAEQWKLPQMNTKKRKLEHNVSNTAGSMPEVQQKVPKFDLFTHNAEKETLDKLAEENNRLYAKVAFLTKENEKLETQNRKLKTENLIMKQRVKSWNPKRMNQAMKRKNKSLASWIAKCRTLKAKSMEVTKLREQREKLSGKLKRVSSAKKTQKKRYKSQRQQGNQYKTLVNKLVDQVHEKNNDMQKLDSEVKYWQNQNLQIQDALDECTSQEISTKRDGKTYTTAIREASYHLQDLGISQSNASRTLQLVVKSVTGKELSGPLPCYTTQNYFSREMKSVSRQQVVDVLKDRTNLTLKYDGTTKKVGHLVETEISTENETMLVGLQQQTGGTANEYVKTITETIGNVEKSAPGNTKPDIMSNLVNTMTDRCKTNEAVDTRLDEKLGHQLNRFRCAMHPLDSMAKECEKVVKEYEVKKNIETEKTNGNYPFLHRQESNTQGIVRCTGKLFYDPQCNCDQLLVTYLKQKGAVPAEGINRAVVYHRFVGNRFHIYFLNSGLLYHYSDAIQDFFSNVYPPSNVIQQSVVNAIKLQTVTRTTRALGLIGKLVTGPWMRLVGEKDNILEMNQYYAVAKQKLEEWSEDAKPLLSANLVTSVFGEEVPVKRDAVFDSLQKVKPSDTDEVVQLVQDLSSACLRVVNRQLQSQLPGGTLWEPNENLQFQAKSCSTTNISGERNFAIADKAIEHAKNATPGHIEAKVMFKVNKTGNWLMELSDHDKSAKVQQAMKDARHISKEEKERKAKIQTETQERLRSSREKLQAKDDSKREKIEQWFEVAYQHGGLWLTERQIQENVVKLSKTKAKAVLKAQIHIRSKILKCTVPQENRVALSKATVQELQAHLRVLLATEVPEEVDDLLEIISRPETLVGHFFAHQWVIDGKRTWCDGQIVEKVDTNEFKVTYTQEEEPCFLTCDEIMTDIVRGDLELHQN